MDSRRTRNRSPLSSADRKNVYNIDQESFQQTLIHEFLRLEHDKDNKRNPSYSEGLVLYRTSDVSDMYHYILHTPFMYQDLLDFDADWYMEANNYVKNLDVVSKFILKQYTKYGDVIVNLYMRTPSDFYRNPKIDRLWNDMQSISRPFGFVQFLRKYRTENPDGTIPMTEDIVSKYGNVLSSIPGVEDLLQNYTVATSEIQTRIDLVQAYIEDLKDILKSAPRPTKHTRVFRGIDHDFLRDYAVNSTRSEAEYYQLKGFVSTSANPYIMRSFGKRNVHEIILDEGTYAIPMESISEFPEEMEILVIPDMWALPDTKYQKVLLQRTDRDGKIIPETLLSPGKSGTIFYSRNVYLSAYNAAPQSAGSAETQKNPSKMQTKTRRSAKSRQKTIKTAKSKKVEPFWKIRDSSDPLYVKGIPPIVVQHRLMKMRETYNPKKSQDIEK